MRDPDLMIEQLNAMAADPRGQLAWRSNTFGMGARRSGPGNGREANGHL